MTAGALPDRLPEKPLLEGLEQLPREVLGRFDDDAGRPLNRCFYLSTPLAPSGTIVARLGEHALNRHPLFTRNDEVEAQWRICDPVLQASRARPGPLPQYPAGLQGPAEAESILAPGHEWRRL